jgi:hypothetical protein
MAKKTKSSMSLADIRKKEALEVQARGIARAKQILDVKSTSSKTPKAPKRSIQAVEDSAEVDATTGANDVKPSKKRKITPTAKVVPKSKSSKKIVEANDDDMDLDDDDEPGEDDHLFYIAPEDDFEIPSDTEFILVPATSNAKSVAASIKDALKATPAVSSAAVSVSAPVSATPQSRHRSASHVQTLSMKSSSPRATAASTVPASVVVTSATASSSSSVKPVKIPQSEKKKKNVVAEAPVKKVANALFSDRLFRAVTFTLFLVFAAISILLMLERFNVKPFTKLVDPKLAIEHMTSSIAPYIPSSGVTLIGRFLQIPQFQPVYQVLVTYRSTFGPVFSAIFILMLVFGN